MQGVQGRTPETVRTATHVKRAQQAAAFAQDLIVFADGVEDAGYPELARRSRDVARETIWLVGVYAQEMQIRIAMQQQRDAARALFMDCGNSDAKYDGNHSEAETPTLA